MIKQDNQYRIFQTDEDGLPIPQMNLDEEGLPIPKAVEKKKNGQFRGIFSAYSNVSSPTKSPLQEGITLSPEEQARVDKGKKQFELSDITIDENDPLKSINNAILERTIKYKPPQSESTKQQYLLPEHQQRGLSDNLSTYQSKVAYEQVKHQMFPTFRVAENYKKNRGTIDPTNQTDIAAEEKYNKGLVDRNIIDQFQIPEMAAVEQAIADGRTDLAYLQKQGKEIPKEEIGRLLLRYMNNPNNIEYAKENPQLAIQLKEVRDNFPSNYPDATIQQLAQYITDKRQEKGYNTGIIKTLLPIHKVSTGDEIINEGIDKGDLPNSWKPFYDKYKQIVDLKVKTPDITSNLGEGIATGGKGILSTAAAPLESVLTSESDVLQDELSKTDTHIKPKGLLQNITVHGSNFTGFMLPMIGGGQLLKAANILKNSAAARDMALFGATSLGEDINRVRVENPDISTGLQYVLGLLSTGQKVALASKLGFGKALEAKINTAPIKEIVEGFTNGKITSEEAIGKMQKLYEKATEAIKGGVETGATIGSMGVVDNLLKQVFSDRPFSIAEAGQAGWEGFKSGFFGGGFLKTIIPNTKPTASKVIYESLQQPEKYRTAIESSDMPDVQKAEALSNFDHALNLYKELPQDWTDKQKRQFITEELIKKAKTESLPQNEILAAKPTEEINKHQENQKDILEGKDVYKEPKELPEPEETLPEGENIPSEEKIFLPPEPEQQPQAISSGEQVGDENKVRITAQQMEERQPSNIRQRYLDEFTNVEDSSFDWRMSSSLASKDRKKAVEDIKAGKNTAAARLLEKEIQESINKGTITINRGRGNSAETIEMPIEEWFQFTPIEKENILKTADKLDDFTTSIIRDNGITLQNIDELKHLFDGFPYTKEDLTTVKDYLSRQGESSTQISPISKEGESKIPTVSEESQTEIYQSPEVKELTVTDVNKEVGEAKKTIEEQFKAKKNELIIIEGEEMSASRGKRLMEKRIDTLKQLINCLTNG